MADESQSHSLSANIHSNLSGDGNSRKLSQKFLGIFLSVGFLAPLYISLSTNLGQSTGRRGKVA